jgi:hypothetical protein
MDMKSSSKRLFLSVLIVLLGMFSIKAQTVVTGVVKDAVTLQPIPYVSVYFKGSMGVTTSPDGTYTIKAVSKNFKTLIFSYVGYKTVTKEIEPGKNQQIDVIMERADEIGEVIVSTKRGKYRNKDNPAVELIRKVIDNKKNNRVTSYDYVQYDQYEKLELSLMNTPEKLMNSRIFRNYKFILENKDTTKLEGKSVLPIYLEEILSQKYFRKSPYKEKTYVLGNKKVNLGDFVDNAGVSGYLSRLYQDVDIYNDNIDLLTNQFLSPIADLGPTFYMYYIRDTIEEDNIKLIKLDFYPRNTNDLLFKGTMFITLDGKYGVQKINMSIGKNTNINWARQLRVNQQFEKGEDGRYRLILSNTLTEFALKKDATGGIIGERTVLFKNYKINTQGPDSVYQGSAMVYDTLTTNTNDSFWIAKRPQPLTEVEGKVYKNIDSLVNMKSFKNLMDLLTLALAGYKQAGPFEIGPVSTFYSFTPIEGFRLRVGGRSTTRLSKVFYTEEYLAYGFKDKKWKYFLSGTYSFNKKSVYSYPLNYLRFSYQKDTKIPGQELQFVQEDNLLLSFKRGNNRKWLYNDIWRMNYVHEFGDHVSYDFGIKRWKQLPAGDIFYQKAQAGSQLIPALRTTELSATFRWAPKEQYYQGKLYRTPIFNKYPIFTLRYIAGVKGLFDGEYNYHNISANIFKRFYVSQFGFTDITLEGTYIFGKVPYPLMNIHRANQTFSYQLTSYNLMNFMEFVSDRSVGVNIDHYFNGFIFNKIPLFKKLKFREVITAKFLYGSVRDENNPAKNRYL